MKVLKHLKSDWFRYGFETLAVIVGILIAFALDNWHEKNIERKETRIFITHISYKLQQYYALCNLLLQRETISNEFIRDKYEPYYFDHLISGLKLIDAYQIREKYGDDPRQPVLISKESLVDNYELEMKVLIRLVHTEAEKKIYIQLIEKATELKESVDHLRDGAI